MYARQAALSCEQVFNQISAFLCLAEFIFFDHTVYVSACGGLCAEHVSIDLVGDGTIPYFFFISQRGAAAAAAVPAAVGYSPLPREYSTLNAPEKKNFVIFKSNKIFIFFFLLLIPRARSQFRWHQR